METHYELLGVESDANGETIAKAYLRKTSGSRQAGFFRGSSQSRAVREQLEEAFEVLTNPGRRAAYDRSLADPA
jgi:curved DNA-binding protein CbpA